MFTHAHAGCDRVADHDDPEYVASAPDLAAGAGGIGKPLDPAPYAPALNDDDRQEGQHAGPAQLIG